MGTKTLSSTEIYSTDEVLAASWSAFRINENQYIQKDMHVEKKFPNWKIIVMLLNHQNGKDFNLNLEITDEDYQNASQMRDYFYGWIVKSLSDTSTPYSETVTNIISSDQVSLDRSAIFILASMPSVFQRMKERQESKSQLAKLAETSLSLDFPIGSKVDLIIKVLSIVLSKKHMVFVTTAVTMNLVKPHIVFFFGGEFETGKTYNISAKIKAKKEHETYLNWVRNKDVKPIGEKNANLSA
ncbi:Uncharacterised protein [uncultured archaeon]|nr:Uncharacterised protein [uncultured archaeon]